jgi:hypothetical protein
MSIFDNSRPRTRGCPVCGDPNTMLIAIQARELGEGGRGSGRTVARSLSLCAEHGEAAYKRMTDELEALRT